MDEASFFSLLTIPPSLPDRANASKFIAETLTQVLRKLNSLIFRRLTTAKSHLHCRGNGLNNYSYQRTLMTMLSSLS